MSIKRLEPEGAGGQPRGRGRWEQNLWYRSPCDRARAKSLEFYTDVTVLSSTEHLLGHQGEVFCWREPALFNGHVNGEGVGDRSAACVDRNSIGRGRVL